MTAAAAAALLNLLGYITGLSLYTMLLVMLQRGARAALPIGTKAGAGAYKTDRLPLLTALLGVAWNLGALLGLGVSNFGGWRSSALLGAAAFTAMGFLPAVVVHSVLRSGDAWRRPMTMTMLIAAYTFSAAASFMHFYQAIERQTTPSHWALHILTAGFSALIIALLAATRGRPGWGGAGWVVALAVFAVSAVHLSHHDGREYPWWVELAGHHASLPLALVILYQDYRFALADIFLKRALSLVLLVGLAFVLYLNVAAPTLERRNGQPAAIGLVLGLWVATALAYPGLRRAAIWFVDVVVLRRTDYEALRTDIAQNIALLEAPEQVLDETCARLAEALTAREVVWEAVIDPSGEDSEAPPAPLLPQLVLPSNPSKASRGARPSLLLKEPDARATIILAPTAEAPQYRLMIGEMAGGRRLMSDDEAFLESVAIMVARRIDAARVTHERCARDLREQETTKLATEAELKALRAQVNPHFLFNSLTTIGYLIQTAPDRAFETLMRLTALLRGVLRRSEGEFATLGEEIELIESYLDIERARFEDRLRVTIDAPRETRNHRIPAFIIQPLVENAIKHGVSPSRMGGEVVISAQIASVAGSVSPGCDTLKISVHDTGLGASEESLIAGRNRGVGLSNVERRLKAHYGDQASFNIRSAPGAGMTVELSLPIK
jgi:two-component system LytT family sensor kinase